MVQHIVALRKYKHAPTPGGYFGLVMTFPTEENALLSTHLFVPSSYQPFVDFAGRRFNIGKIKGVDVIYVMSGEQSVNAAITIQSLFDNFDIFGIIHYGIAGSSNNSLTLGDVSVMKHVAFTSSWKWKEFKSEKGEYFPELRFGAYNFPNEGENELGKIEFKPTQLYSVNTKAMEEVFWFEVDSTWFDIAATQLRNVTLQQWVNSTYCLPEAPKVVFGLKGSTANIFVHNAAYRKFLFNEFNVSTVDEESAAVVMTCLSNGVPCIVFRGVSDMAGSEETTASFQKLASTNAVTVAVEFIELISKIYSVHDLRKETFSEKKL
jgi:nucleoside phosphorylase